MSQTLFEGDRLTLPRAIDLTVASLAEYGQRYRHWAIAFSGGKDSSAVATLVPHLIASGRLAQPASLTILYADTRMELPPLQLSATATLARLATMGFRTEVVLPELDDRFFVYMLGRGVPPPKHNFRWCTPQLKIEPMLRALRSSSAKSPGRSC
jgi:DNA sulfur modification protein DndC